MIINDFSIIPRYNKHSGVYVMCNDEGKILYVGQTENFYNRMGNFGEPEEFCIEDVHYIYLIHLEKEYLRGIEAALIGIFQSFGNYEKYHFYDEWIHLINNGLEEEIRFILARHYSCFLPEGQTLMQFLMQCKYKTVARRVVDGKLKRFILGVDTWYSMDSKEAGWAIPLIVLLSKNLNGVIT